VAPKIQIKNGFGIECGKMVTITMDNQLYKVKRVNNLQATT